MMARHFGPGSTPPDDEVHLRLVKTHDKEVICDQHGRVLDGVMGFRYEQTTVKGPPLLTVQLVLNACEWDQKLGVVQRGEVSQVRTGEFDLGPPKGLDT